MGKNVLVNDDSLKNIGNAIRAKNGESTKYKPGEMAAAISNIETGTDTSDATGTAADLLAPKTMYGADGKKTGTIPSKGAQTYTPGTTDQTIAAGQYLSGAQTIKGDANLIAANIKKDVEIFGVPGTLEGSANLVPLSVTQNGAYVPTGDVDGYSQVTVNVSGGGGDITVEPLSVTQNGTTTAPAGKAYSPVTVAVPEPSGTIQITENGVVNVKNYESASVAVAGGGGSDDLDKYVSGQLTALILSSATSIRQYAAYNHTTLQSLSASEVTSLGNYAFQNCSALASVNLPKITQIASYAFQNCSVLASLSAPLATRFNSYAFDNCKLLRFLNDLITAAYIDSYALRYAGQNAAEGFEWRPSANATAGQYAFQYSKVKKISGPITSIQYMAFDNAVDLEDVDLSSAVVSSLGQYAFRGAGKSRADDTVPLIFDLRSGTFTTLDSYAFAEVKNAKIYLPTRVTRINANVINGATDVSVYINDTTPPTLASTTVFDGATGLKLFIPYDRIGAYESATNWAALADSFIAYAPAGKWTAGTTLPTQNAEGSNIVWYTNTELTDWVVEVPEGSPELYCKVGIKNGWYIDCTLTGMSLNVTDTNGNTYPVTDGVVTLPRDVIVDITPTFPSGWVNEVTIDGTVYTQYPVRITANKDYELTGIAYDPSGINPSVVITAPTGSTITMTNGSDTRSATEDSGTWTFVRLSLGEWTINASLGSETKTQTIVIDEVKQYTVNLAYTTIYGAEWDGSSSTAWTRTDAAAAFSNPVPAVNNGTGSSPFDNLMPWSGMTKIQDATGGVLVAIPKFYYKWTVDGSKLKLQIADGPSEGFYVSPAHADRGDGNGERDYVYVGRYHCASDYKSTTGVKPKANVTRSSARSGIHALGNEYWQSDYAMRVTIQMLYLVEFADWNSQNTIGLGCGNNSSTVNMGATDAMQYHTGTSAASAASWGEVQYRWIEGLWANVLDWMDGCYYNSNGLNVIMNPANFSDSANGTNVGAMPSGGYPKEMRVGESTGFEWCLFPKTTGGSDSTYVPDYWGFNASSPCLFVGGYYVQNRDRGLFYVFSNSTSSSSGSIGCRLQKLP